MKTLVVGGTGIVGSSVVQDLLHHGASVRCLIRSPAGAKNFPKGVEIGTADLNRPETLPPAFEGADNVFLFLPMSGNETAQGLAAAQAARTSTIKKIVYVSVFMPPGSEAIPHFRNKTAIELAVRDCGSAYTILRPNHFFQTDLPMRPMIMGSRVYPLPIGSIGLNRVDVRDVADAAVNALIHSGYEGQVFGIHGAETLTGRETAMIYGAYLGSDVQYGGDDLKKWERQVKSILPPWLYSDLREMYRYFQKHGMIAPEAALEKQHAIVGHKPRSFRDFVKQAAAEWSSAMARAA